MATPDPDWEVIRKFRFTLPQVYTDLCISHLCDLLDLSVDIWKTFFNKATCYSTCEKDKISEPVVTYQLAVEIQYLIHQLKKGCNLKTRLLFRKPSSKARSKHMRTLLSERRFAEIELGCFTPCDYADVLKRILRDAREPLLTSAFYVICCQVKDLVKPRMEGYEMGQAFQKQLGAICILFLMLPEDNYLLLQELLSMLHNIHLLREHNDMNAHSLAVCLAPALICPREFTMKEFHRNCTDAVWVLEFMIENALALFVVPQQLVEDAKIQQSREWYIPDSQSSIDWQDETLSSSISSISSLEYMEPFIEPHPVNKGLLLSAKFRIDMKPQKHSKLHRSNPDIEKKIVHKNLSTSKSWSFNDLRASHVEATCEFDETPMVAPCGTENTQEVTRSGFISLSPPSLSEQDSSLEELDFLNLDEQDSMQTEIDRDSSKSFWSRRRGFFRKLFPGKEHKKKSPEKKKQSWFSGFKDKENMKMPPGGHAGSEKGLNGIRSYCPSSVEIENKVEQELRDINYNVVPEHLRVQKVGSVESRYEGYQTLKNATCTTEQLTLNNRNFFKPTSIGSPSTKPTCIGVLRKKPTCTEEQFTLIDKNFPKNTNTGTGSFRKNTAFPEERLSLLKKDFSENASSSASGRLAQFSESIQDVSQIIARRNPSVSSYCKAFRLQENRDWFESLESPLKNSDDFQEVFPNSPLVGTTFTPVGKDLDEDQECLWLSFDKSVASPLFSSPSAGTDWKGTSPGHPLFESPLCRPISSVATEDLPFWKRRKLEEKKIDVFY